GLDEWRTEAEAPARVRQRLRVDADMLDDPDTVRAGPHIGPLALQVPAAMDEAERRRFRVGGLRQLLDRALCGERQGAACERAGRPAQARELRGDVSHQLVAVDDRAVGLLV